MFLNIVHKNLYNHETKRRVLLKFGFVVTIFFLYFLFIAKKYGVQDGFFVATLSWSFFVLCTPIADAGFLIDFPLRLITNIKMLFSEIIVWVIAITLNVYAFFVTPTVYDTTPLLSIFKHILEKPIPFWSIVLISAIGTFISIGFGDELMDKTKHHEREKYHKHKNKYKIILMIFLFAIAFVIYDFLLKALGINVPI